MGRVIALGPGGKAQAPVRDDRCRPVIEVVLAGNLLDRLLISPAVKTRQAAAELERALYRSCRYFCSCDRPYCTRKWGNVPSPKNREGGCPKGGRRVSCQADVVRRTDPRSGKVSWHVQFTMFDKREAMREVVRKYGPDPNAWPYYARRKQLKGA